MIRRTTENTVHEFQKNLYDRINAFDLQGLTMNENRDRFTAGVEYFDLSFEEYQQIRKNKSNVYKLDGMLPEKLINAQIVFTAQLGIPLYYIWGYEDNFLLLEARVREDKLRYRNWWINYEQLVSFWHKIKQTVQTHPFDKNGAKNRTHKTRIDAILESNGLEWGGNIDGFILKDGKVGAIIDCISIGQASQRMTHGLTDPKADPALYFNARGPKYETWLSTIILARTLNVPHLLFTLNKVDMEQEAIGLAGIDKLTRKGINYYQGIKPNGNVIRGIDNISNAIFTLLREVRVPQVL